ncbi:MAG TPA: thioredoxin domain-containing protein, partial [Kofleriaceae bacterium]
MKNLVLLTLAASTLVACQSDTKDLNRKMDEMQKDMREMKAMIAKGGGGGAGAAANQRPQRAEPDRAKVYAVPVDGDPMNGNADAKVTLVKAYDYACPYCEKVRDTMDQLKQKYGNDIRIVYKQLVVHPRNAMAGALAFCAANKQGKALQMDTALWDKGFKQRQFDNSDVAAAEAGGSAAAPPGGAAGKCWDAPEGCKNVVGFAQEIGLDVNKFKADMKGDCQQIVQKDMADLQKFAVAATPSFFINGRFLSGAMPIENFTALVDEEL